MVVNSKAGTISGNIQPKATGEIIGMDTGNLQGFGLQRHNHTTGSGARDN